jgi:hypothetical protein
MDGWCADGLAYIYLAAHQFRSHPCLSVSLTTAASNISISSRAYQLKSLMTMRKGGGGGWRRKKGRQLSLKTQGRWGFTSVVASKSFSLDNYY